MKTLVLIFVWLCSCCITFAQRKENFKKLIKQTNTYFDVYQDLSPFSEEYYALKELGITKQDIQQLAQEDGTDAYVLYTGVDSLENSAAIVIVQEKIRSNIKKIIAHPDFKKYDIRTLLTSSELNIVKSEDNKLYNFSFDAKNGGSYRMQISIMYYSDYDVNKTGNISGSEGGDAEFNFSTDGYTGIHSISTSEGTKYVLTGYVRGCSQCFGSDVTLITFKDNRFVQEFYYSVSLRDYESGVEYDPETKTISVNYKTDDLTPDCTCENQMDKSEDEHESVTEEDESERRYIEGKKEQEALAEEFDAAYKSATEGDESDDSTTMWTVEEVTLETEREVEDEEKPIIRQCSCTFVFDGKTFQLKKKSSLIVDTEED